MKANTLNTQKKPSVVFINPPSPDFRKITRNCDCASESKGNYLLQPFDFLYLSSSLHDEDKFIFIDAVANQYTKDEALNKCSEQEPTHIVTAIVDLCWENDYLFLQELRKKFPQSLIFTFGDVTVEDYNRGDILKYADGIIDNAFSFDLTKTYDEDAITKISEGKIIGLSSKATHHIPPKVPKEIVFKNFPKHHKFENQNYRWPFARHKKYTSLATNWGCPFACSYCIDSVFPFNYRSAESIESELHNLKMMNYKELVITDKSFGHPRKNTLEILKRMEHFDFLWSTYIHPNQCDDEMLAAMKKAGCHTIIIGIESNKEEHLKEFNRTTNQKIIYSAIANAKKYHLDVCGDFLIGLPHQTTNDVESLIEYALSLDLDYASFNLVAPLPGSKIKKMALEDGRMKASDHHFDSVGNFNVLRSKHINESGLIALRKKANLKFYLRWSILLRRLRSLQSFEHLFLQLQEGIQLFLKKSVRDNN